MPQSPPHRNAHEQENPSFSPLSNPLLLNSFSPPRNSSPPRFPRLINPKHRTRQNHQPYQIAQTNRLSLKHRLQKREINDEELSYKGRRNGEIEQFVGEEAESGGPREG